MLYKWHLYISLQAYYRQNKVLHVPFFCLQVFIFMLMWFQFYSGFSGGTFLDDFNLILFNLVYTSLPPIVFGIMEQDISASILMARPTLYKQGPKDWVRGCGEWGG